MAHHGGGIVTRIFLLNVGVLSGFDFTTVFQDGRWCRFMKFALVSIFFLFQTLIYYIN